MTIQQTATLDKLREQQSGVREHTAPWMVAQQLMDISNASVTFISSIHLTPFCKRFCIPALRA